MKVLSAAILLFILTHQVGLGQQDMPTGYNNNPETVKEIEKNREVERQFINLAPLFGGYKKSKKQIGYDEEFIERTLNDCKCTKREASKKFSDLGWGYFKRGNSEIASKRFNQAYLLDSLNYSLYWGFGAILGNQYRDTEAIELFSRAYRLAPNRKDTAYSYLCWDFAHTLSRKFWIRHDKKHAEQALQLLEEAERIYPGLGKIHYEYSRIYFNSGNYEQALEKYRKAISLDSTRVDKKFFQQLSDSLAAKK